MSVRGIFTPDDARRLRINGYLEVPMRKVDFLRRIVSLMSAGLAQIETIDAHHARLLNTTRNNKDKYGRLLQGFFQKLEDMMVQCNFVDFTDGRMDDYAQVLHAKGLDFETFFKAFCDLNEWAETHITTDLARAIDRLANQYADPEDPVTPLVCPIDGSTEPRVPNARRYSIADLLLYPKTKVITSATTYAARTNSGQTSARPNTAAFAIYWFATNPGMKILDLHGEPQDLSGVERDIGRILVIPGTQLARATNGLIQASMHPIFPETEGLKRFTLRTFVYFNQDFMDHLVREQSTTIDPLLLG